jgi:monothiol glutaredoxin
MKEGVIMSAILETIRQQIAETPVVLYMKGTPAQPQCGFSSTVVHILKQLGVSFQAVNVLETPEIRQGIKEFTSWPTVPQLYLKGEFIGGCDIVREMYQNGELQALLQEKGLLAKE